MKKNLINACCDLGVNVNGSRKAPLVLSEYFNDKVNNIYTIQIDHSNKSYDKNDFKKNIIKLNKFNEELYNTILNTSLDEFNITIGGDHSIAIASSLASIKRNDNLGIIWIDSHADYNTFKTTRTGNIHGVPLATINEENNYELTKFHEGKFYNPKNTVIIGARDIDSFEMPNLIKAGVKIFTTKDIKEGSIKKIVEESISIATTNTNGIHISCDIDVIDPTLAKGISVPAIDGINISQYFSILEEIIKYKDNIKSFDFVEYNPDKDSDNKTIQIAKDTLKKIITEL